VDLSAPDVAAATSFYTGLFGWTAEPVHDESGNHIYTMLRKEGRDVAGLGGQPPGMTGLPPVWNSYVSVADCDDVCTAIEKAGGWVLMPPMQVFGAGRMAVAADPTGARFSLWEPLEHHGAGIVSEPDTYAWNELLSSDVEVAKNFYAEVFGWTYEPMAMGPAEEPYWVIQGGDAGGLGGLMLRPKQMPADAPDSWGVYFMVTDVDAKIRATLDRGGQVCFGPEEVPGLRIATLTHPDGGMFSLMQPTGVVP